MSLETNLFNPMNSGAITCIKSYMDTSCNLCQITLGLAEIPAPDGSQEVVVHTHKCSLLIGEYLPACRMDPRECAEWVPPD